MIIQLTQPKVRMYRFFAIEYIGSELINSAEIVYHCHYLDKVSLSLQSCEITLLIFF